MYLRFKGKDIRYLLIRRANLLIFPGWQLVAYTLDGEEIKILYKFLWNDIEDLARSLIEGTLTYVDMEY